MKGCVVGVCVGVCVGEENEAVDVAVVVEEVEDVEDCVWMCVCG